MKNGTHKAKYPTDCKLHCFEGIYTHIAYIWMLGKIIKNTHET